MYIIRLLRKEKCNSIFEICLVWILIAFGGLALLTAIIIGLILSKIEMFACWICRLFEKKIRCRHCGIKVDEIDGEICNSCLMKMTRRLVEMNQEVEDY